MELWIRSQDKKRLVKAEHIYYCEDEFTNNELKHYICITGAYDLGVYKSKERALEVLDEIHQRLINIQCLELTGTDYISNQMKRNGLDCVYQMPEN